MRLASALVGFSALLGVLATAGCVGDPPRDNPFDPGSEAFHDVGSARGSVTRFYSPEGIAGARVRLIPMDATQPEQIAQTGPDGTFRLAEVPTGTYVLIADAEGYAPARDTIEVPLGGLNEPVALALDGIPVVTEQAVRTEYIERWWPPDPLETLIVEATVSDPDGLGDIEEVLVAVPALGFADTLQVVPGEPDRYRGVFVRSDLGRSLFDFLGATVEVAVTDGAGVTGFAPGAQVLRIVDAVPQPLEPSQGDVQPVGPTPLLTWIPLVLPYPFTYTVEVVFVPAPNQPVTVRTFSGLPASQTAVQVTEPLPNGSYFWLLSVVDQFGNRSQSKSASFLVVTGPLP